MENKRDKTVSSDDEQLILVDSNGNEIGFCDKARCHQGAGLLHRAFSVFVFNAEGHVLLQQRAPEKRLWGGYWANSCCSHPRRGESTQSAAGRRLHEELGLQLSLDYLYQFEYRAEFADKGVEHELCSVWVGRTDAEPDWNRSEIQNIRWMAPDTLSDELARTPDVFTPWLHLEWQALRTTYAARLNEFFG